MKPSPQSNCQGLWLEIRFPGDVSVVLDLLCSYLQVRTPLIFSCTPRGSASILHKRAFNIYELIDFQWISAAFLFLVIEASLQPIRPSSPSPCVGRVAAATACLWALVPFVCPRFAVPAV